MSKTWAVQKRVLWHLGAEKQLNNTNDVEEDDSNTKKIAHKNLMFSNYFIVSQQ